MKKSIQNYLKIAYNNWQNENYIFTRCETNFIPKTFKETIEDVLALAESFNKNNYKRIMIYSENSYEWMITDLAVMGYVGINIGIDKEWKIYDIRRVLDKIDIDIFLYSCKKLDIVNLLKKEYPKIKFICMNDEFYEFINDGKNILKQKENIFDFDEKDTNECSKIVFSSGTSSFPKAVMLSQKNMFSGWDNLYKRAPMNRDDKCYLFLPLHHTYAGVCNFLYSIISGMKIYLCSDTANMVEELSKVKPTVFCAVPLIYEKIYNDIKNKENAKEILPIIFGGNIKYMFSGGAYFNRDIRKFYKDCTINIMEAYALSETSSIFSIQYSNNDNIDSVGTIFENIDVKIDNDEIIVKGDNVFIGYYGDDNLTKDSFNSDGYFKTGDLGYIKNNDLYITGRKKKMLLGSNGENISPEELEDLFSKHEYINKVKVYMKDNNIFATFYINNKFAIEKWIDEINENIPKYKQIKQFEILVDSIDNRWK